jgi:hypothetical protein
MIKKRDVLKKRDVYGQIPKQAETWANIVFGICKDFLRIRIHKFVILNYGSGWPILYGLHRDIFVAIEKNVYRYQYVVK